MPEVQMYTHKIVYMKRKVTKSGGPMWACRTDDNVWVNAFAHLDPKKNSFACFQTADYSGHMLSMGEGEELSWATHPIEVQLRKNGEWWDIVTVASRRAGATPDVAYTPDLAWHMKQASRRANLLLSLSKSVFFDTETTDIDHTAEMIAIGGIDWRGVTGLNERIRPRNLEAVARQFETHHLTREMLLSCPSLPNLWSRISAYFSGRILIAYNAEFDARMLEQNAMMYGLDAVTPNGYVDAMELYSRYAGLWNEKAQRWSKVSLSDAAASLGIETPHAHDALADTVTLYGIVKAIAEGAEVKPVEKSEEAAA